MTNFGCRKHCTPTGPGLWIRSEDKDSFELGYIIYLLISSILILCYVILCCLILSWFRRKTWGNGGVTNREVSQWVQARNQNHKVASSKPNRSSVRIKDLTSFQSFNWPVGRKLNKCSDLDQIPEVVPWTVQEIGA